MSFCACKGVFEEAVMGRDGRVSTFERYKHNDFCLA